MTMAWSVAYLVVGGAEREAGEEDVESLVKGWGVRSQ